MRSLIYSIAFAFAFASMAPVASAKENPPVKGAYDAIVIDAKLLPANHRDIAKAVEHHCKKHHKCHKPCVKGDKRVRCTPCKKDDKRERCHCRKDDKRKHCRKGERRHHHPKHDKKQNQQAA